MRDVVVVLVLSLILVSHNVSYADNLTVAVLGDSLATGAVAHPALRYDRKTLLDIFTGKLALTVDEGMRQQIKASGFVVYPDGTGPRRLIPSSREADAGALSWVVHYAILSFSHRFLDAEELSWGYLVATSTGVVPSDVLIAAEDGARMSAAIRQVDRVLDAMHNALPRHLFMFFTGNDLCGPTMDYVTGADEYGEYLEKALLYMLENGSPGEQGADIWVMDPVGLLQLVQSESIQKKEVEAHGRKMRCSELQTYVSDPRQRSADVQRMSADAGTGRYSPVASVFVAQFPESPAYYCPTVLGLSFDGRGKENQTILANRLRSYREEIGTAIAKVKQHALFRKASGRVRFHQITGTGKVLFNGEDIANDCFHLSLTGQLKIARTVMSDLRAGEAGK